jgi:large subunit ribosomal protein L9
VAEQLDGMVLSFTARASETGKLYGSINTQMIAESITEKTDVEITRNQVYTQPLRTLGEHTVQIRLTVDLIPEVTVIVNSEGEEEIPVMQEPVKPESDEVEEEVQEEEQLESSADVEQQDEGSEAEQLEGESQVEVSEEDAETEQPEEEDAETEQPEEEEAEIEQPEEEADIEQPEEETEVQESEEGSETESAEETAVE